MGQRRHHYERAFEAFVRDRRIPCVVVDEARKTLLPRSGSRAIGGNPGADALTLKSFDFVLYGSDTNLLVDVKGRRVGAKPGAAAPRSAMQNWVTQEDLDALRTWRDLFGRGFGAAFVFLYWCDAQPPDGLFQETFEHEGRWYVLRLVTIDDYARHARPRSERWGTVHVPAGVFETISRPLRGVASIAC